jgi:1-pyrroline-5-carboxylate dehydrogenase
MADDKIISYNPANKEKILGRVSKANKGFAEKAMQAAVKAFETWKKRAKTSMSVICTSTTSAQAPLSATSHSEA